MLLLFAGVASAPDLGTGPTYFHVGSTPYTDGSPPTYFHVSSVPYYDASTTPIAAIITVEPL